jgi:putative transposase
LKLGIKLSKRTVQKYMRSVREHRGGGQGWATFCATFDRVAKGAGTRVLKTAVRAPNMNPVGERFVGSLRREALDHVLFLDDQHLENVARQYVCYFNTARPHQDIGQRIPDGPVNDNNAGKVIAIPVLGGLHHDYRRAA